MVDFQDAQDFSSLQRYCAHYDWPPYWWDRDTNPLWDNEILCDPRINERQRVYIVYERAIELTWLRATLQSEDRPSWLIGMVLERWPDARKYDLDGKE